MKIAPKLLSILIVGIGLSIGGSAIACDVQKDYEELSRVRMSSEIASVFALTGNIELVNVTAKLESGDTIMMSVPAASAEPGAQLVVEKVTLADKLNNGAPMVHYDLVEVLSN
ncbi:MAG: hypothetical protein AAF420_11060 [Pseudomonadota bacterium]